jgi:hypothetical protein
MPEEAAMTQLDLTGLGVTELEQQVLGLAAGEKPATAPGTAWTVPGVTQSHTARAWTQGGNVD